MEDHDQEVIPTNPRCPICGAVDWFGVSDLGLVYKLKAVNAKTGELVGELPVEGFTCRSCRFLRLRAVAGTLDWSSAEDAHEKLRRMFGG